MKVLITGTSRGIGRAIAERFLKADWEVVGVDTLPPPFLQIDYQHYKADILKDRLPEVKGVDVLINNAGRQNSISDIDINLKGTMRVTEQIDAMDIMGINSANFIVLPKILGFVIFVPVLCVFSMFFGLIGGWFIAEFTTMLTVENYIFGIQSFFNEWYVWYGIIKTLVFAFLITSIAAFYGYYVKGGALEVGKASTNAVVSSSILILLADVILTKLLLQ